MHKNNFTEKKLLLFSEFGIPIVEDTSKNIYSLQEHSYSYSTSFDNVPVSKMDLCRIQPTGGTTGYPKGCEITNEMLYSQGYLTMHTYTGALRIIPRENIITLCTIGINHIYGYNSNVNICQHSGGSIVLADNFSPENIQRAIRRFSPTIYAVVPTIIVKLNALGKEKGGLDFHSIKGVFCGSSALPVEVITEFEALTGTTICEGYGMSESTGPVTINPLTKTRKIGSCGIPRPATDLLLVDLKTGTTVVDEGEVIVRGPTVFSNYWNNLDETSISLKNKWLYTGDIARMDADGYLYILGRKKDLVITGGENVYPREVEEILYELAEVSMAACIGIPDTKKGELLKAYIQLNSGATLDSQQIIAYCKTKLARFKVPSHVEFIENMPCTAAGKINKEALKNMNEDYHA